MIYKYLFIQSLITLIYLNNASGQSKPDKDELDRLTITKTGCKYLALGNGESYSLNSSTFEEYNHMILLSPGTERTLEEIEFHFAIRSDTDLQVIMFSRKQYNKNPNDPDFKFEFEADFTKSTLHMAYDFLDDDDKKFNQIYTPNLLSADKYVKLYIAIDEDRLKIGKECEPFPFYSDGSRRKYFKDIVLIGFSSKSEHGAKILFDCPENFGDCKCGAESQTKRWD